MRAIYEKTLRNMFKPIVMGIYFFVILFVTILIFLGSREQNNLLVTIQSQIESIRTVYSFFVFAYLSGVGLIILIMIFGLDIFATEEYEGTMRILVAKPVSRFSIIFGKIKGLLLGSFIYYILSLLISTTIFMLFMRLDRDVFIGLIKLFPSYILYGLFFIILFSSIVSLLSSLFKKKVPSIIIIVLLVLGTYGILPTVRTITLERNVYYSSKLYYIDLNSHLGNIYMSLIELGDESNELHDPAIVMFTGRYINSEYDPDLEQSGYISLKKNDMLNVNLLASAYLLLSALMFYLSYKTMIKKDIT